MGQRLLALLLVTVMLISMLAIAEDEEFIPDAIEDMIEEDFDEYFEEEDPIEVEIADGFDNNAMMMEDDDIKAADDDTTNLEMLASMFDMQTEKICWALHMTADEINALDAEELRDAQIEIELMLDDKAEVQADEVIIKQYGQCGETASWKLTSDGVLTVYGIGATTDYDGYTHSGWQFYADSISKIVVEKGITSIGDRLFNDCTKASEAVLPEGLIHIGEYAFSYCNYLTTINFPSTLQSIGTSAFRSCRFGSVRVPEGVQSIGESAFSDCKQLKYASLPSTITSTGRHVFNGCAVLSQVDLAEGIEIISTASFMNCYELKTITVPASVTSIEGNAFYSSTGGSSVTIAPKSHLSQVGANVFYNAPYYGSVRIHADDESAISAWKKMGYTPTIYDHLTEYDYAVEPTCINTGLTMGTHCSLCGKILQGQEVIPIIDHVSVRDDAITATCSSKGFTEGAHCAICNTVLVQQAEIPMIPHKPKEAVIENLVPSTCSVTGHYDEVIYCDVCKGEVSRENVDLPAVPHVEVKDLAVPATCFTTGLTEGSHCSVCGTIIVAQTEISTDGHTVIVDPEVQATCTELGYSEGSHCSVCNDIIEKQIPIVPTGHIIVADATIYPTCEATGLTAGAHCSVCGEILIEQNAIPAKGHTKVIDRAIAPTCSEEGLTEGSHCIVCDAILEEQKTVPVIEHKIVTGYSKQPTTCEAGATSGSYCVICDVILSDGETIPPLGVYRTAAMEIGVGETFEPEITGGAEISFVSTNPKAVSVDESGCIKGMKAGGSAVISVSADNGYTEICTITVKKAASKVTLPKTAAVNLGDTLTLIPKVTGTSSYLKWGSSNVFVATVQNGIIIPHKTGTATITVKTFNGKKATCKVTVYCAPESIEISDAAIDLIKGKTATLKAAMQPAGANPMVTWITSDADVATVSGGKVTAKGIGTCTITAITSNGIEAACSVNVTAVPTKVTLNSTKIKAAVGKEVQLSATVAPEAASQAVTWTTSNKSIATVENGVVTLLKAGTVKITAKTPNGKIAGCTITVTAS